MRDAPLYRRPGAARPGGPVKARLVLACLLFLPGFAGAGDESPAVCTREILGQLSCQAGVRCECRYFRDSTTTDMPGGYRWDCGINRGRCDTPPATLDPWMDPYPSSIGIDRTRIYELPPERDHPSRDRGRPSRDR